MIVTKKAAVNAMIAKRRIRGMANGSRSRAQRDVGHPNNSSQLEMNPDRLDSPCY